MITNKSQIKRISGLIERKINNEYIVLNPKEEKLYYLNETAECIYRYLSKSRRFEEVLEKISKEFNNTNKNTDKDLKKFFYKNKGLFTIIKI